MTNQTDPQPAPIPDPEQRLRIAKQNFEQAMTEREARITRRIIVRSRSDRNTQNPPASAGSKGDYAG